MRKKQRLQCKHGHPWLGANVAVRKDGREECRTCQLDWKARTRAKHPVSQVGRCALMKKPCPGCEAPISRYAHLCRQCRARERIERTTHCPAGHPYTSENLYAKRGPNGNPVKVCRICQRAANARYKARRKQRSAEVRSEEI